MSAPWTFSFEAGAIESSHIGAFERYVFDGSGGNSSGSGGGGGFDVLFPDGAWPRDGTWKLEPRPGQSIAVTVAAPVLARTLDAPVRASLFVAKDKNRVTIDAPRGFGIFTDPARIALEAEFIGVGADVAIPVYTRTTDQWTDSLYVGAGGFLYRSYSDAWARSAFLDLHITDAETRIAPLGSLEYRFEKRAGGSAMPDGCAFKLSAFKTGRFLTVFTSASIAYKF